MIKRILDFSMALFALIVLSPLLAVLALFIALKIGRPILFIQERAGRFGTPFKMYKFRTMTNATDRSGVLLADADRLTPVGNFLRAASLDELPELWNILRGEMSFVGPRPLLLRYLPRYNSEQQRRHLVRPGLTGYAQVNGRNSLAWEEKFALDTWYVDNQSFFVDLKILLLTAYKIFDRGDVNGVGCATAEEFMGSTAASDPPSPDPKNSTN